MKALIKVLSASTIAVILGLGSAALALRFVAERSGVHNGPWRTDPAFGSLEADLYTRAYVARAGLFALNKSETIYFIASRDADGDPLRSSCDYRIEGRDLPARWWSITLYGSDFFLVPNTIERFSYNGRNVARTMDGGYLIRVSAKPHEGNWLPSGEHDQIYLNLRLYNPEKAVYENPGTVELPRIIKEGCR